ncbi:MAG: hypothetical protein M3Y55_16460 [Pseudomonadota bacterium]|nr:hypothetical protein [Pseudomonadota bacterium]
MASQPMVPSEPMRLDEPGAVLSYVASTEDWKRRFAARILEIDSNHDPAALVHVADDLSLSAHWRLMAPEEAAEALFEELPRFKPPDN